jgi:hypothetical protein
MGNASIVQPAGGAEFRKSVLDPARPDSPADGRLLVEWAGHGYC